MSFIKKLTAFLICMTVLCGCLVSCVNPDSGDNSGNDDQTPLQSDRYVATVKIKYATNDNKMKAAIDALGTPTTTLTVDGDDLKLVTSATLDDISTSNEYIYVGGVLYQTKSLTVSDKSVTVLESAAMSQDQLSSLISKAGPGAGIGIGDFLDFEINTYGDITEYNCGDMLDDSKESLRKIVAKGFDGIGAIVRIDSASYKLEIKNGRNHSSILSCDIIVTLDGVDHEITMHLYYDYDYDADVSISAPDNADEYTEVSVDKIIG